MNAPTTPWQKWLARLPYLLIGLAVAVFVGYLIVYCLYAFALFRFPFDYDQGEGFELMDTVLFSHGQWPYRDNNLYPFYASNYPPLFHVVVMPLVWLFGAHYWTGRLVSFIGTLITAGAIGYAVYRQYKVHWVSLIAGLSFLASNYIYHVGPLFRQHLFMVMFETLAVVWLAVAVEREEQDGRYRPWHLLGILFLLLCAGYTKQLAYATVAAVFLFLFLRHTKRAILAAIPFAIVTGLVFVWIDWATGGLWRLNTVTANINPFVPGQAEGLFRQWFTLHTVLTATAVAYAVYELYFDRLSAYTVWFVVATANSVTAGKWGAGESYFATAIAGSCILTGLAFSRLVRWSEKQDWRWQTAVLTLLPLLLLWQADKLFHLPTHTPALRAIAAALGHPTETLLAPQTSCSAPQPPQAVPYVDSAGVSQLGILPTAADTAAGQQIAALIAQGQTPAFSEDAGFNLYLGRDVITNPTQLLNLYNNGRMDLTEMVGMINAQAFDTVVLRAQFYPPPVLDAIGQNYQTQELIQMHRFVYCVMHRKEKP